MKLRIEEDLFLHRQPDMDFLGELTKPLHAETPPVWNRRKPRADEVFIPAIRIENRFPDPEGLLETAFSDFDRFLTSAGIKKGDGYLLSVTEGETECREAYRIEVSEAECRITAADTEGVRRAII